MNINILRYFLFGIAGGQEVDHTFVKKDMLNNWAFLVAALRQLLITLQFFCRFLKLITTRQLLLPVWYICCVKDRCNVMQSSRNAKPINSCDNYQLVTTKMINFV